jgi:hypothetical protein
MVNLLCQKNIQLVGKIFALVKYSIQEANLHSDSFGLCLSEMPLRALVTLVKKLVKFLFALFGFLVGFSEKCSTFPQNIQFFKTAFSSGSGCQMPELSTGLFYAGAGMWPHWGCGGQIRGLIGAAKEPDVG